MEDKFDVSKIKLIVGLGNVGKKYENTRHNAGFLFLDYLSGDDGWAESGGFKSFLKSMSRDRQKFTLMKPSTLMNRSGDAVQLYKSYYKLAPEEILVAHDDLDIALGKSKLQFGKGPKGHNGILDIERKIGTALFWRLRIGVDNRNEFQRQYMQGMDYVLERFSQSEFMTMQESFGGVKFI